MMQKFRIENIDCPSCAAGLEATLQNMDCVRHVSLNFMTSTLQIDTDEWETVKATILAAEPQITLTEISQHRKPTSAHTEDRAKLVREGILLAIITITFIVGLFFQIQLAHTPAEYGTWIFFIPLYLVAGGPVLRTAWRNIRQGQIFDENFLMSLATVGAILIRELPEAVGVMVFYRLGEFFQELSVIRSRRSIQALLAIRPDIAHLKTGDQIQDVDPEEVRVGQLICVKPGEKIPLDGIIVEGDSQVDTSALTGESVPRGVHVNDEVFAGTINKTGTLTVRVSREFGESSIAKVLDLVENATNRKAKTEKFITVFARYYTPIVVLTAIAIALLPPLLVPGASFTDWVYRALVVLVISCPCALVISIPLSYFGGIGGASRRGILIKGSNYLDVLAKVKTVVFDKTGTLTQGVFNVVDIVPHSNLSSAEMLHWGAHVESQSNHPIAQSIVSAYGKETCDPVKNYQEIAGHGVQATVANRAVTAGNDRFLHHQEIDHSDAVCQVPGTVVHLAVDRHYAGYLRIDDELKPDAAQAIRDLKHVGVDHIVMLTGDNQAVADRVGLAIGIDHVKAELLPEDKLTALEDVLQNARGQGTVAFVGDGINDAPVIARADVGLAMGGLGSDAAIETADVVLMDDAPTKVAEAIRIAKKTRRIVWQNIVLALGIKGVFIGLGAAGIATMWGAVFADVGVALLAVFNAMRALR